jgi:SAM-dependent methyltransferase
MSTPEVRAFDPDAYKRTTRQQWQATAEAWHRWGPTLEAWLGQATQTMLDMAGVTDGVRVLDIAAGAGGQTIAAAQRVGPSGTVLAVDISPAILEYAQAEASTAGLSNVTTRVMDGEDLGVERASFDAVISRLGLMYFPDQQKALGEVRRSLRVGGRVAAIVYSAPERNPFNAIPMSIIRRRAALPPPLPGQPGLFSLGATGVLADAFETAGFHDVEARLVEAPLRLSSAAECVRLERESFGGLRQMLSGLSESERSEAWVEIETALATFEGPDGFVGPCELVVAAGTR